MLFLVLIESCNSVLKEKLRQDFATLSQSKGGHDVTEDTGKRSLDKWSRRPIGGADLLGLL